MENSQTTGGSRREFLTLASAATATLATATLPAQAQTTRPGEVVGREHWAVKRAGHDDVRLFMWRKVLRNPDAARTAPPGGASLSARSEQSTSRAAAATGRLPELSRCAFAMSRCSARGSVVQW